MKLLSSDYDLTLKTFEYDLRINMHFVNEFRKKNNVFLLNTGRSYSSIKREIDRFHINYDYLSCCDGNLVLDKNSSVRYVTNLNSDILGDLNDLERISKNLKIRPIFHNNNILEYEVVMPSNDKDSYLELLKIAKKYGLCVKSFNRFSIDGLNFGRVTYHYLYNQKISKATSTLLVSELENIERHDIFTIGDHDNDFEMIREFNGYTLPWGKKSVKEASDGICLSVASLVKKISR